MRQVTCRDCGKAYDYDRDDFCPKCGSFNRPGGGGATELEEQLLSRFNTGQAHQTRTAGGRTAPGRPHASESGRATAVGPEAGEGRSRRRLFAALLLAALCVTGVLVVWSLWPEGGWGAAEPTTAGYTLSETIPVGKLEISVDDVRYLNPPEGSRLIREGYDILLVDVYITGGSRYQKNDPVGTVSLTLRGGEEIPAVNDILLRGKMKDLSEHAVSLSDALWEDPLVGSFAFYVPRDAAGGTLCMNSVRRSGGEDRLEAVSQVELTFPARTYGGA